MRQGRQQVALCAALATLLGAVATFWLAVRLPALGTEDPAASAAVAPFVIGMVMLALTGWLLVRERASSRMGWLLLGTGLTGVLARLSLAVAVLAHDRSSALAPLLGWITNWVWLPTQLLAMVLILRFPDGRLPGPRWRLVERAVLVWGVTAFVVTAFLPGPLGAEQLEPLTNPLGLDVPALEASLDYIFVLQPLLLLIVISAPVRRWGSADSQERRQLRVVAFALLLIAVTAPLAIASGAGQVLEGIAWLALPGAIAWAAGRHGLWDMELRHRLDRLRRVRDAERSRLQRELHDSLGPLLGSISMRVEAARNLLGVGATPAEVDLVLATIGDDAETAVVEVRRFIEELGPSALADADLVTAMRELVAGHSSSGVQVTLSVEDPLPPIDASREVALYRVAGEAVRNAVRHSGAGECRVSLRAEGSDVVLEVVDDGVGLRGQPAGVGRRAMAERIASVGGSFTLVDSESGGVMIAARLDGVVA